MKTARVRFFGTMSSSSSVDHVLVFSRRFAKYENSKLSPVSFNRLRNWFVCRTFVLCVLFNFLFCTTTDDDFCVVITITDDERHRQYNTVDVERIRRTTTNFYIYNSSCVDDRYRFSFQMSSSFSVRRF